MIVEKNHVRLNKYWNRLTKHHQYRKKQTVHRYEGNLFPVAPHSMRNISYERHINIEKLHCFAQKIETNKKKKSIKMLAYGRLLTLPATTEEKYYKQKEEEEGNNFKPSVSQVLLGQYLSQPNISLFFLISIIRFGWVLLSNRAKYNKNISIKRVQTSR